MTKELEVHIRELAQIATEKYNTLENIGVLAGQSGVALFQFYCAQYFDEDSYAETGVEIISNCIDKINEGYSFPTYCNGIAGFGWALQHLFDQNFIDLDLDELLTPFDNFLFAQMQLDLSKKDYDFLHGAMGYGFYFLKRLSSSSNINSKQRYQEFLVVLVEELEKMAIYEGATTCWESVLSIEQGNKGYNLSLSHGMSSIVFLLSRLHKSKIERNRVATLVSGAINYMKKYEKTTEEGISLFPSWIDPKVSVEYNSRLAWCYGDIGIARAFDWGAEVLHDLELKKKAEAIFVHTGARQSAESSKVVDAGYCHGSFGNAHIFHQLVQKFPTAGFEKVGQFWLNDGLSRKTDDPEEPYMQWGGANEKWEFRLNLLEGLSGIGLTLIDFLSEKENTWDECLMLR